MRDPARLEDVARAAGVSLATASRVLAGNGYPVSQRLRERVLRAAEQLHYVPNAHARALASAGGTAVGLLVHDITDPYFAEIARGALRVAEEHSRLVLICNTYHDPQRERAYLAELRAQRVAAVVLGGSGFTDPDIEHGISMEVRALVELGIPAASTGRRGGGERERRSAAAEPTEERGALADLPVPSVCPDNRAGAAQAARHLVGLGHRNIGILAGPRTLTTVADRLDGALRVLHASGIRPTVVDGEFSRDGGAMAVRRLLTEQPGTTAVLALGDVMALGALRALREDGRRVPDELSLVGFDDIPTAVDVSPALTTVRVPMARMGALATAAALDGRQDATVSLLPTELVVRESCAVPSTRG